MVADTSPGSAGTAPEHQCIQGPLAQGQLAQGQLVQGALTRRGLIRGVGVGGMVAPLLVACGDGSQPSGDRAAEDAETGSASESSGSAATIATSDVPVGGGTILAEEMVVVTQPTEGEFQAFSARCTHQGCPVQTVSDGRIGCNCHGSAFSIRDGSVLSGPAPSALDKLSVSIEGDQVTVGS